MRKITATFCVCFILSNTASAELVTLQSATATFSQSGGIGIGVWPIEEAIDGDDGSTHGTFEHGWAILDVDGTQPETAVFETVSDIGFLQGSLLTFSLYQNVPWHNLGRFRLSATTDPRTEFADGLQSGGDVSANWSVFAPSTAVSSSGSSLTVLGDDSILASGVWDELTVYTVTADTSLVDITGFRLEVLLDNSLPTNGPGRHPNNGNFGLSEFEVDIAAIPEPSTLALCSVLVLTGIGAGWWRRRRAR